jgi:hypothetical protein
VTITALSGSTAVRPASDWLIPDGKNGADEALAATLPEYVYTDDLAFKTIKGNNVGMVKLATPLDTTKELDGSKNFLFDYFSLKYF